jgi:hypothetical protein
LEQGKYDQHFRDQEDTSGRSTQPFRELHFHLLDEEYNRADNAPVGDTEKVADISWNCAVGE